MIDSEKSIERLASMCAVHLHGDVTKKDLKLTYEKSEQLIKWTFNKNSWNINIAREIDASHNQMDSEAVFDDTTGFIMNKKLCVYHENNNFTIPIAAIDLAIKKFFEKIQ
ncbi:MAG: hypothetical protein WC070_01345 [Candidatus Magasanikbacteria bacterium]